MKLILGNPVVVDQGPTYEEVSWGPWQFPSLRRDEDGVIYAGINTGEDSYEDYGTDPRWYASKDNGLTWELSTPQEAAKGLPTCENGDRFEALSRPPEEVDESYFEGVEPIYTLPCYFDFYKISDLSLDENLSNFTFNRIKNGETKREKIYAKPVNYDENTVRRILDSNRIIPAFTFGRTRKAPDGSLWQMHYDRGINPDGKFEEGFVAYYFRSADNGVTWEKVSAIYPKTVNGEYINYCEQDITWIDEKHAVTVLRSNGLYCAVSNDGGYTWGDTFKLDDIGVDPSVLALKCGAVLTAYGRPGFFVKASFDGTGEIWEDAVEIIGNYDHSVEMNSPCDPGGGHSWGTCSYSDMVAISDNEALVAYTNFYVPDKDGIKRKSLMVIKVAIEK